MNFPSLVQALTENSAIDDELAAMRKKLQDTLGEVKGQNCRQS